MQSSNGKVNEQKLKENLSDAIDVYIRRVNKCSCGDTVIHLYKDTDSLANQDIRKMVKTFFLGTTDDISQLKEQHPNEYKWIESICELQKGCMISGLPSKYVFHLICCYKEDCVHPLCQKGKPVPEPTWYEGSPPIRYTPIPVPDKNR